MIFRSTEGKVSQGGNAGIEMKNLRVVLTRNDAPIVRNVSLNVEPGSILGLVGESGSGKTTVGLSLLGYARSGLRIAGGAIRIGGVSMLDIRSSELTSMRGREVAYVPQDPAVALHPGLRLRTQLAECLRDPPRLLDMALYTLLEEVGLQDPARILASYPHELSGGQQQRIAIAMAFAPRPQAIVMDEPTTALDVTTQTLVLAMIKTLAARHRTAILYVSHDLSVVDSLAHHVAVMYSGEIVESGGCEQVLRKPLHPYTQALIRAVPDPDRPLLLRGLSGHAPEVSDRPTGCTFAYRCGLAETACTRAPPDEIEAEAGHVVRCIRLDASRPQSARAAAMPVEAVARSQPPLVSIRELDAWHGKQVLHGIGLDIASGRCTALVGESGSGKTTLARCIAGLHPNWSGSVLFDGKPLPKTAYKRPLEMLRRVQYVFQNPYASLNPRQTIGHSLTIAARHLRPESAEALRSEILDVLAAVGLPPHFADLHPGQLSGGQRQRAAIARGLICRPDLLICDEVTSALDVSIQATIVELLTGLRESRKLSILFVAHNIGLVRSIAQDVAVMQSGAIVESGTVETVLSAPKAPETKRLMRDAPRFTFSTHGSAEGAKA
jgi:peptide/nickel transport system ATP-binding protein